MPKQVTVTIVVDNAAGAGLRAEHGLSMVVDVGGRRVLFDTGAGEALLPNAAALGVDLSAVEAVVLSHGHYDHTGGLAAAVAAAPAARLFLHPRALSDKFHVSPESARYIGMPDKARAAIAAADGEGRVIWTGEPTEVVPGLFATGAVPRFTDYESPSPAFCEDMEGREKDPITDDQALFFESRDGTVVLLGCAHSGVVNTMRCIAHATGGHSLHAVIGGMHLHDAGPTRLRRTVGALADFGVRVIAAGHCTGDEVVARLRQTFAGRARPYRAGVVFEFDLA